MRKIFLLGVLLLGFIGANADSVPKTGSVNGHTYVDLGLPSGLKWATCNIGANKPWKYGNYYAWGEIEPKEVYNWSTYKWGVENMTKYNSKDGLTALLPEDDAATANWGNEWRMPTNEEQRELYNNSYMVWTDNYNGTDVKGVVGLSGYYWSSSLYEDHENGARHLNFDEEGVDWGIYGSRYSEFPVRAVTK